MKPKKYLLLGIAMCFISSSTFAQIFAQGKNINNENAFFITIELVPKPMDEGKFHACIDFYGRRGDVKWFLKEGVEHKAFFDQEDMISYLQDNGWFYLQKGMVKTGNKFSERYYFRKSMEKLSLSYESQARADE